MGYTELLRRCGHFVGGGRGVDGPVGNVLVKNVFMTVISVGYV